jgi:hypothetical protein
LPQGTTLVRVSRNNITMTVNFHLLMLVPCCNLGRGLADASSSHWSFPSETAFLDGH